MTELPDDILRAFAELPREREPRAALEERVVRAVFPRRRRWIGFGVAAAAAVLLLVLWQRPRKSGDTYILLLSEGPSYVQIPPGQLEVRRREYGRWADSLARLGKLDLEGSVEGSQAVDGLFIIRAANDADAERIAQTCPHIKYHGRIEVRRFIE